MSDGEETLADSAGVFVQLIEDGRNVADLDWLRGRLLLSNRRIVLVGTEGKRTIPLADVGGVSLRENPEGSAVSVPGFLSCQVGADVFLLGPADFRPFRDALFEALLDDQTVLVKHPVVKGGVVTDTDWESGKLNVDGDVINLAIATGTFVEIPIDEIGAVAETRRTVAEEERRVLEIEHGQGGESVETHLSGSTRATSILATFARRGASADAPTVELTTEQRQVVMALYTGVSPFEIPDFVGMDVEAVEGVFDDLAAVGILEKVRTRREVELKARGRSIAGDAMTEQ